MVRETVGLTTPLSRHIECLWSLPDPGTCTEGAVQLADGVLEQEGRVEVCINGVWGSVCGTGWNTIDGYVLCKQAGFDDAGSY